MYADRFTGQSGFSPSGLAAAIGINAAVIAALMVAAPYVTPPAERPTTTIIDIPVEPPVEPPPPPAPAPLTEARPVPQRPDAPIAEAPSPNPTIIPTTLEPPPLPTDFIAGTGTGPATAIDPPAPPPVIVAPRLDPRYTDALQPDYPPTERRLEREGKVTVRVLVGTDGRVKQVERVFATSDAFYRATELQALRRWRLRPGTRDGVPQEAWHTMTVTFVMQ